MKVKKLVGVRFDPFRPSTAREMFWSKEGIKYIFFHILIISDQESFFSNQNSDCWISFPTPRTIDRYSILLENVSTFFQTRKNFSITFFLILLPFFRCTVLFFIHLPFSLWVLLSTPPTTNRIFWKVSYII